MIRHIIFSVAIVLAGCSPQLQVYSDMDPDYDLWTYKTFDWGEKVNIEAGRNPLQYNELNDKRIKNAVLAQMQLRGYVLSDQQPDLLLHYHIIIDDRSLLVPEPFGYQYGLYWMRLGTNVYYYREGTLILDLLDRNTHNLVWRGWVTADVNEIKAEQVEKVIKRAVEKIFRKFPAQARGTLHSKDIVSN
jgi:hypothetical protein